MDAEVQKPKESKNPVKFIGAGLLLLSVLVLPWIKIPLMGSGRILEVLDLAESSGERALVMLSFGLVLIAGIIAIFKPRIGGIIGIVGLYFSINIASLIAEDIGEGTLFSFLDFGYYIAWVGVILCLFSNKIYKAIKQ